MRRGPAVDLPGGPGRVQRSLGRRKFLDLQMPVDKRAIDAETVAAGTIEEPHAVAQTLGTQDAAFEHASATVDEIQVEREHARVFAVYAPVENPRALHFEFCRGPVAAAFEFDDELLGTGRHAGINQKQRYKRTSEIPDHCQPHSIINMSPRHCSQFVAGVFL